MEIMKQLTKTKNKKKKLRNKKNENLNMKDNDKRAEETQVNQVNEKDD